MTVTTTPKPPCPHDDMHASMKRDGWKSCWHCGTTLINIMPMPQQHHRADAAPAQCNTTRGSNERNKPMEDAATTPTNQPINPNVAPPGCIAVEPPVKDRCTGCKYAPGTTCTLGGFGCGRKSRADRRNVIFIDAPTPTTQPAPTPTPPPARPPTCSSCRFWDTSGYLPSTLNFAQCHRHPPRVNFGFPSTYPTSWCGEHRERNEA